VFVSGGLIARYQGQPLEKFNYFNLIFIISGENGSREDRKWLSYWLWFAHVILSRISFMGNARSRRNYPAEVTVLKIYTKGYFDIARVYPGERTPWVYLGYTLGKKAKKSSKTVNSRPLALV
jgi:hypothetical protein